MTDALDTLILGIGNVLWADEGFGVRCIEALNERYEFKPGVRLMDGGTQGIFLLPWVRSAERLLIFDAIDFGLPPGSLRLIRDGDVPRYMGAKKVSMHQTGFQEVLASAGLISGNPERLALIGVQPEVLDDYGGGLRPLVRNCIPDALTLACGVLEEWGIDLRQRTVPPGSPDLTGPVAVALEHYEKRRLH